MLIDVVELVGAQLDPKDTTAPLRGSKNAANEVMDNHFLGNNTNTPSITRADNKYYSRLRIVNTTTING